MNEANSNMTDTNITARETGMDRQMEKQATSADVSRAHKRQTHDRPPDMEIKIGKTTYRVWAHFSKTTRETLEDKIKRMLRDDVRRIMQTEASM